MDTIVSGEERPPAHAHEVTRATLPSDRGTALHQRRAAARDSRPLHHDRGLRQRGSTGGRSRAGHRDHGSSGSGGGSGGSTCPRPASTTPQHLRASHPRPSDPLPHQATSTTHPGLLDGRASGELSAHLPHPSTPMAVSECHRRRVCHDQPVLLTDHEAGGTRNRRAPSTSWASGRHRRNHPVAPLPHVVLFATCVGLIEGAGMSRRRPCEKQKADRSRLAQAKVMRLVCSRTGETGRLLEQVFECAMPGDGQAAPRISARRQGGSRAP